MEDLTTSEIDESQAQPQSPVDTDAAFEAMQKRPRSSEFRHNMFVLQSLVTRDFKLKYRRSILGILWSVLNPLLMMIVMAAVFSYMFKFNIPNFPLYLILGTVLFDYMNRSTSAAVTSIIDAQSLIKKIRIDKMIFPVEKVVFELVNFAISLVAVLAVLLYFTFNPTGADATVPASLISPHVVWGLPFLIVCVTMFCAGLGLLLSALAVFFRDVMHLWSVLITAWTYATPLFYPYDLLDGWMQQVMQFNPMYHYVLFFRNIMMNNAYPGGMECVICVGMAVITFIVGLIVFRKTQNKFILHI